LLDAARISCEAYGFGDEVGAVFDQLRVETENGAECAFNLGLGVVGSLETADGCFNQRVQSRNVLFRCETESEFSAGIHKQFSEFDG